MTASQQLLSYAIGNAVTSGSLPMRQVILHRGDDTTNGYYSSNSAMHDSLFSTEIFDWNPGTQVSYYRGVFVSDTNCIQAGGTFMDTTCSIAYTTELVFADGHIDSLERTVFAPWQNKFMTPRTFRVTNGNLSAKDVFIRIRRAVSSGAPVDSLWDYAHEFATVPYDSLVSDSSYTAYKKGSPMDMPISNKLNVLAPYPNPLSNGENGFYVTISYEKSYNVKLELLDQLGRVIVKPEEVIATGYWQNVKLPSPISSGVYYLRVTAGNETQTLPVTVTN